MTLSCANQWKKSSHGPGIYVNEVKVVEIEDISGTQLPFMQEPVDIGIKLKVDIGRDFLPEMIIAGNFKREHDTGEVIGWGGAFVVQEVLSRLGFTGELDRNNRIPPEALAGAVGKKFLRLTYISGVGRSGGKRYTSWHQVATPSEGAENLVERFKRSLRRGFPKNYAPDILEQPVREDETSKLLDDASF